jgi:hypothetical protein
MANTKAKIKLGMGGSNSGKSRWEHTDVLKSQTKKRRRKEGKEEIKNEIK